VRVVFAGTSEFAVPALRALAGSAHAPLLLITQPDRPKGRGLTEGPSPVGKEAIKLGLPLRKPASINDPAEREAIAALQPDVMVVVAYGQKIGPEVLPLPRLGCVNLHGSLLPAYRGASPIAAAIRAGETKTGVSVIRMNDRIDAGEILGEAEVPIGPVETAGELTGRLAEAGAALLVQVLDGLAAGEVKPRKQNEKKATVCKKIGKDEGRIRWAEPAVEIARLIRALSPKPGAFGSLYVGPGQSVRITFIRASAADVEADSLEPGSVLGIAGPGLRICAGKGAVDLLRLKPANGREMEGAAFFRGLRGVEAPTFEP
jgi:methionyl-tRNA formyltransferase